MLSEGTQCSPDFLPRLSKIACGERYYREALKNGEGTIMTGIWRDVKYAVRSLAGAKGLTITVVLTLALGIGANAAIFTLVRGVLLRPLVNRDEDRLIFVQQSAPGISPGAVPFSVPEIQDLRSSVN